MRVISERFDEMNFGNILVVASSPRFHLRVSRDRGVASIEIRPSGGTDWHFLEPVLAFLDAGMDTLEAEIDELAKGLLEKQKEVAALMGSDLVEIGFAKFEKEFEELWEQTCMRRWGMGE